MRLTVDTKPLASALAMAGRVVPSKSPIPILSNVLIEAAGGEIVITATNMDMSCRLTIPAEIETDGAAAIPLAPMSRLVSKSGASETKITLDGPRARVAAGRGRVDLATAPADDFPHYAPATDNLHEFDAPSILRALRFCGAAASSEDARWHISGVQIVEAPDALHFWGTDAHRLHHARMPGISEIGGGGQIPRFALSAIAQLAGPKLATIKLAVCETGWAIDTGAVRAWGKVIDATFPDVERVLNMGKSNPLCAIVSAEGIQNAASIATIGASAAEKGMSQAIAIRCEEHGAMIMKGLRAADGAVSAGRAEIDADVRQAFAMGIAAGYLSEAVAGMEGESVVLSGAEGKPLHVAPQQQSGTLEMEAIVMGLRATPAELADDAEEVADAA